MPAVSPAPSGLAAIYAQCRPELLRFLLARTGDAAEAEDLLQELWLRTHQAADGPIANGRAYLYRAAQNLVLDRARDRRRRQARDGDWVAAEYGVTAGAEPADGRATAEQALVAGEELRRLRDAIERLPPAAGRAFRLHKLDGLPHAAVARQLGISRSGVEKHMAVALACLRRAMKDCGE